MWGPTSQPLDFLAMRPGPGFLDLAPRLSLEPGLTGRCRWKAARSEWQRDSQTDGRGVAARSRYAGKEVIVTGWGGGASEPAS